MNTSFCKSVLFTGSVLFMGAHSHRAFLSLTISSRGPVNIFTYSCISVNIKLNFLFRLCKKKSMVQYLTCWSVCMVIVDQIIFVCGFHLEQIHSSSSTETIRSRPVSHLLNNIPQTLDFEFSPFFFIRCCPSLTILGKQ